MTDPKPFRADIATDAFPYRAEDNFLLPFCMPKPELITSEELAAIAPIMIEGRPVGANNPILFAAQRLDL